ncbi:uncharacterized protein LOC114264056 [Camellia sinensis]|uniref:uncharacterized protein LOC114264056 n=1 Tax=Camellia sinensis TaxID=4442 RepID=UPI00103633D5|nr:uncharacterized protein LOC114264056 [Camellia sinensis]
MRNIWCTRDDECLTVNWNILGQPDDKLATKLSSFIGTIVRDGKNAPLIYKNWHKVPEHYKDHIWALVQSKFDLPSHARKWVMKCSGKKLKDWKGNIKKNYYKNHLSFDQQKHYKDSRVYADKWEHLIKYWAIEEVKVYSI